VIGGDLNEGAAARQAWNLFRSALDCQRRGDIGRAEALYAEVVELEPDHAGALHLLGAAALARGAAERARDLLCRAAQINAGVAEVHADLGNALQVLGRPDEALASYDQALRLKPRLLAAVFNRALLKQQRGALEEALADYDHALAIDPRLLAALYNRAVLLGALGRLAEAMNGYDACLRIDPGHMEALNNRGIALLDLRRPAEALVCFDAILARSPGQVQALNNRGNALRKLHRHAEAIASFDRAVAAEPAFAEAFHNRGNAQRQARQPQAALMSFDTALRLRPDHPRTLFDRAETLVDLSRHGDAAEGLTAVIRVAPQTDYVQGLRLHTQALDCDWTDYPGRVRELLAANQAGLRASFPFPFLGVTDSAAAQKACARTFAADLFPAAVQPLWRGKRYRHKKIRIVYLSGDFRNHPVSLLLAGVIEKHDRARFEVSAMSLRPIENSPLGSRIVSAFDEFVDVSGVGDAEAAGLLRKREADIVIDLMGFTRGARSGILAYRPAPVQVNYLGFPGTMGVPFIDYIIADEFLIPGHLRQSYAEQVVWLPGCFQANDDGRSHGRVVPARREMSLPDFGVVFCCFNNTFKINPECFDRWMRIVQAVPGSVLWLLGDAAVQRNLGREAQSRGVDPRRLVFAGRVPYDTHLARLQCADLFLDTLPFNAGTTAGDTLWAGVPVLTCPGEAFASRMAGSLLTAMGLAELVARDGSDYERLAVELGSNPSRLAALRRQVNQARATARLFDSERFCRHLESAYSSMWKHSEAGRPAAAFAVPMLS